MPEHVLGGRYRIVRHLARGGMAEVYLAQDQLLDRPVAVKVMFPELARDPSFVERFRREARSAAILNHPNIVSVFDFGEDPEGYYIVMEYIAGRTLSDLISSSGPLPPADAIAIASDVAAALAAAHREGIIHRDIKPANVLIATSRARPAPEATSRARPAPEATNRAMVTDFGIARAADAESNLTMPGTMIGTATYLSPEQAQGLVVGPRSDLYSLGMVLYEMLTGRAPFRGDNPVAIAFQQQQQQELPPPSLDNPAIGPRLDALVAKALSVDPADRQQSAEELGAELRALAHRPASPPVTVVNQAPLTTVYPDAAVGGLRGRPGPVGGLRGRPAARPFRRRQLVAVAVAVLAVVGLVATIVAITGGNKPKATVPSVTSLPATTTTTSTAPRSTTRSTPATTRPAATTQPPTTRPASTVPPTTGPPATTVPATGVPTT